MRIFASIFLILPFVLTSACSLSQSVSAQSSAESAASSKAADQPHFKTGPCWGTIPSGVSATCGYVSVPEDRRKPFDDENSIQLAIVVLRAPGIEYTQPPTFLLGGGPGQDVIGMYEGLFDTYQSLQQNGFPAEEYPGQVQDMQQFKAVMDLFVADLQKREFIYFDQRGAGYSQPSLKCHGEDWSACRARLISAGVNLAAYNTLENAADVNELRLALGYEQINLESGSYGTRLGLEVMRQYPQIIRAAILDGVAPPQVDWATEMVRRYADGLQVLFDHCEADLECNEAYPDLDAEFYTLVERLNAQPVDLQVGSTSYPLNGDDLRDTVWNALFEATQTRFLPMMIHEVGEGQMDVWERMLMAGAAGANEESIAWGMHYAVECSERWHFETPQELVEASKELPLVIRASVVQDFTDTFQDCEEWDMPPAPAILHEPVQSDVPALLLSGEFDPGTQPVFAELAARTLSHHYSYVFPYLGHTDWFSSSCHASVMSAFLDHPDQAPNTACIRQMDKPAFVVQ